MGPPTMATGHCPATSLLLKLTNDDPVSLSPFCWLTKNFATRSPRFWCHYDVKIVESNGIGMFCFEVRKCTPFLLYIDKHLKIPYESWK